MPEDIRTKNDKPLRTYTKKITDIFIKKWRKDIYGVAMTIKEVEWRRYAVNMDDWVKFDLDPKLINRLNYKTKFHKFIQWIGPYARHSYFYEWTARITCFMFTDRLSIVACKEYFEKIYYPKFVLKHNKQLLVDAEAMLKISQERVDQLKAEIIAAKKILSVKNRKWK
jgi:hypothetical protein